MQLQIPDILTSVHLMEMFLWKNVIKNPPIDSLTDI